MEILFFQEMILEFFRICTDFVFTAIVRVLVKQLFLNVQNNPKVQELFKNRVLEDVSGTFPELFFEFLYMKVQE